MNITELARQLKASTKELREKLPELGFDIGMRAIKVDDSLIGKIVEAWNKTQQKERMRSEKDKIRRIELKTETRLEAEPKAERLIKVSAVVSVHDLAEKIGLPVSKIITELIKNGIMATINEEIDYETAAIIAEDLGYKTEMSVGEYATSVASESQNRLKAVLARDQNEGIEMRAPVVVVMGHVDHGKTSLLDAIRKTNVAGHEAGAITQHIGAYQVDYKKRKITFIDTPGHEAFQAMRVRGGAIADIGILVIAADDSIQPQTLESIRVIQSAGLQLIVAINKIDKPEADIDRIKKELAGINLAPEGWGGKTICVPVSATKNLGLDDLLEMILLVADLEKDRFRTNSNQPAVGTVIETHLDKNEGPLATVLIQAGTIRIGDLVVIGKSYGKVKALRDFCGKNMKSAGSATPVEILGLKSVVSVGEVIEVATDKKIMRERIKKGELVRGQAGSLVSSAHERGQEIAGGEAKELSLVVRADTLGSLEAICHEMEKVIHKEISLRIVKKELGNITESDVLQAESAALGGKALVIGFNVSLNPGVKPLAEEKRVIIKVYKIIYELLSDIRENLQSLLTPEQVRIDVGELEVLQVFRSEPQAMIIGGRVIKGKALKEILVDVMRADELAGTGKITNLHLNKQPVNEAKSGTECGLRFEGKIKIEVGDILEFYRIEERVKTLEG